MVHPLEPLNALVKDFLSRGGRLWACTPCVKARGYEQSDLIEGVEIAGSSKIHEVIKNGYPKLLKHRDGRPVPGRAGALPDQGDVQGWPRDHPVGFIGYQYFAY